MTKEDLGIFIANNRKAAGMTQQELAEKLHVTNKAVSKWETGLSYPDVTLLEPLANALSVNVEELLTCQKAEQIAKTPALETLLAISEEDMRRKKKQTRRWFMLTALLIVLFAVLSFIGFYQSYCHNWRTCKATEDGVLEYIARQQEGTAIQPLHYEEENGVICLLYDRSYDGYQDQCIAIFSRGRFGFCRYVGMDSWDGNMLHRGGGGNKFDMDGIVYIVYGNNHDGLVDNYTFTCGGKEYGRTNLEKDYIVDVYLLPNADSLPYNLRQFNRYNELICQVDKISK